MAAGYRSAHGVVINDERIVSTVQLVDGDRITLGPTTLVYLEADHPDAQSATKAVQGRHEWKRSTLIGRPGTSRE